MSPFAVRSILALLALLPCASGAVGRADEAEQAAWRHMTRLMQAEARNALVGRADRSRPNAGAVGEALLLLLHPTRTRSNVETARARLAAVAADPAAEIETARMARYFGGRLLQIHAFEPDLPGAAAQFAALWNDAPESVWGQLALVRVAILRLYDPAEDWSAKPAVLRALEPEVERVTDPVIRGNLHRVLAEGWARLARDDAGQLRHTREALARPIERSATRARLLVQAAEAARALGERQEALHWYRAFLGDFPRDERAWLVRRTMAELETAR